MEDALEAIDKARKGINVMVGGKHFVRINRSEARELAVSVAMDDDCVIDTRSAAGTVMLTVRRNGDRAVTGAAGSG